MALRPRTRFSALNEETDLPVSSAYQLGPGYPAPGTSSLLRPPFVITTSQRYRNINLLSIGYAFRPGLRDRLTLSGLTLLRNPEIYGEQSSHLLFRYLCRQGLFQPVHQSSRSDFAPVGMLSYHAEGSEDPSASAASVRSLSPVEL